MVFNFFFDCSKNRNLYNRFVSLSLSLGFLFFLTPTEIHELSKVTRARILSFPQPPHILICRTRSCFFLCGVYIFNSLLFLKCFLPKWVSGSWAVLSGGVWVLANPPPGPLWGAPLWTPPQVSLLYKDFHLTSFVPSKRRFCTQSGGILV